MALFIIIVGVVLGIILFICGIKCLKDEGFGLCFFGLCFFVLAILAFFGCSAKSQDFIYTDVQKYFEITPSKQGLIIKNLDGGRIYESYDIRTLEAYKNNTLKVNKRDDYSFAGQCVGTYYTLEY